MKEDDIYMRRCLELAAMGRGTTYPNPMVGSVIVCDGRIIGEGYHHHAGGAHAEVNAVNSVTDKSLLTRSTIYVSLEPCAHFGKTPPCCDLIIRMGIPRVKVGCVDTFSKVSGQGIQRMRDNGIEVTVGIMEEECIAMNRRFFTYHNKRRPYIILKWAQSSDGYITGKGSTPVWITNDECKTLVHKQRSEEHAILIGANTANIDNPSLTNREWGGNSPKRFILSPNESVRRELTMLNDGQSTTILTNGGSRDEGNVKYLHICNEGSSIAQRIATTLYNEGIHSVIIEGGRQTIQAFIDEGIWDEAFIYEGLIKLKDGVKAPIIENNQKVEKLFIGECTLTILKHS